MRKDHPLRAIRAMVDKVLTQLSRRFDTMYASIGRPSIAPEKLLRAQMLQMLQMLCSIRSERLLMEEMDYNLLFRWFVGLNADDDVWDPDRLYQESRPIAGSRRGQGAPGDLHLCLRRLQPGAPAQPDRPSSGGVSRR